MTRRHTALIAALLWSASVGVAWAHDTEAAHASGHRASQARDVQVLIARGEAALAAGDSVTARDAFEQAAAMSHTAAIEVGWIRAQMQAGEYRRALAFAAHTAGAHPDDPQGGALYAWLLRLGGQVAVARTRLGLLRARFPQEPVLAQLQSWMTPPPARGEALPVASETEGLVLPFGPLALGEPVHGKAAGNAILLPDGRHALVPLALVEHGAGRLWLRNGLGRSTRAEVSQRDAAGGLALLTLDAALDLPGAWALAPREPFAGSPGLVVGYADDAHAEAAWPTLRLGFLGMPKPSPGQRPLGMPLPAGSDGAPVFDAEGRLAGVVLPAGPDGQFRLGSVASLAALVSSSVQTVAPRGPMPVDEIYEHALRRSLQLVRAD